ncbi:MAG: TauD/TfdA family dioxygenase [Isosphaeraceae bacterium]|nr:TauD/TfdA family dioxygenase [Isosphaeraceae bacterium]
MRSETRLHRDPRAWRAADIGEGPSWYHPLPEPCAADLVGRARELARGPVPLVETRLGEADRSAWSAAFRPVLDALENRCGFAIIEGPRAEALSPAERAALYWIVGQALGEPVAQNVQGTLLYDVRDTGQYVSQGARFSVTNAESTFHTDASFEPEVVDYVGLLCLQTARSGGLSQIVSGYAVVEELAEHHPEALAELTRPFHVDRRGGVRPGEASTALRPIIERNGGRLLWRYLRTWIEVGHQKVGEPLTEVQMRALDVLDQVANRPEMRVEFLMRPGEMFFINNRWILHNRTAFEDHPEPERRRHYLRLWLRARAGHESAA